VLGSQQSDLEALVKLLEGVSKADPRKTRSLGFNSLEVEDPINTTPDSDQSDSEVGSDEEEDDLLFGPPSIDSQPATEVPPHQLPRTDIFNQYKASGYPLGLILQAKTLILRILIGCFQKQIHYPFYNEILSFFAIFSWNFNQKVVRQPNVISKSYSAFVRTSQLALIEWSVETPHAMALERLGLKPRPAPPAYEAEAPERGTEPGTEPGTESGTESEPDQSDDQADASGLNWAELAEIIEGFMPKYFHHEASTALGTILAHRALALAISKLQTGAYHDIIPAGPDTLVFKDISLSVSQLVQVFQKSTLEAARLLFDDLLVREQWGFELARELDLSLAASGENTYRSDLGFSFAASEPLAKFSDFLLTKVANYEPIRSYFFEPSPNGGPPPLHEPHVAEYFTKVD
jgi:hypothetical protein